MVKVPYGQNPYSVIGKYIRDHITVIEDIIAVIKIDENKTNQLFMVDMNEEDYFIWNIDWWEGEKDITLIDFFPVSEATNPSVQPKQLTDKELNIDNLHEELKQIHKNYFPHMKFDQFISDFVSWVRLETGQSDIWFEEDYEWIKHIQEFGEVIKPSKGH